MAGNPLTFQNTEVIFVLYAVVALISAVIAGWQIWTYVSQKGDNVSQIPIIIGIGCAIVAVICCSLFLSSRMNKTEEMNIPINQDAPVKSHGEIVIEASTDKVWQILTKINDWPSWQSEVTESNLNEVLKEGAEFKWKAGGLSFTSQIHTVEQKTRFGWTGKTFGASAIHNWFFKVEGGNTVIRVEESLQGVFPRLLKNYLTSIFIKVF